MIVGLRGIILQVLPTFIELEINGVVYGVHVRAGENFESKQEVFLHTAQIIKEDGHSLYGFLQRTEKELFERLLKVNGVGPRVALAILSTYSCADFSACIQSKDLKALQRVPGVGAKLAGKIMLDLAGLVLQEETEIKDRAIEQAVLGLQSLGFKTTEAFKICSSLPKGLDTPTLIKLALQQLK
ncbi:Holliday junction branch migration protein RuvA [Helicobacter suis]|uniref:Holliday junction branch migration protein RuvA n=1 Tax=Helicobacter suis TaxID=104628 RepID=UPI00249050EB|nr:Holliday junction branch migration protein RuvA [Helicobacter suis]